MYCGELNDLSPHLLYFLSCYRNMGACSYVKNPRIVTSTHEIKKSNKKCPRYVGCPVSAAPVTGFGRVHQAEYQGILNGVFGDEAKDIIE